MLIERVSSLLLSLMQWIQADPTCVGNRVRFPLAVPP